MVRKQPKEKYVAASRGPGAIEILFGDQVSPMSFSEESWNSGYRYKNKLEQLPYFPVLSISTTPNEKKVIDISINFHPNHRKWLKDKKNLT